MDVKLSQSDLKPLDYGTSYSFSVQGIRPSNEDAHAIHDRLPTCQDFSCWAVYDGHNGTAASNYCAEKLHLLIDQELSKLKGDDFTRTLTQVEVHYALIKSFCAIDDDFLNSRQDSGSTVALFLLNHTSRILTTANTGDSRCILNRMNGRTETCSRDHKPIDRIEGGRIAHAKHTIDEEGRLDGIIACSRAIGDVFIKIKDKDLLAEKKALSPYPSIRDFLLLDGLTPQQKEHYTAAYKESKVLGRKYKEKFRAEQKVAHAAYVKQLRIDREAREAEEKKKKEFKENGEVYTPSPKIPFQFQTRFFYPNQEDGFVIPECMILHDEEDDDDSSTDLDNKLYKFAMVACDGLTDVMSNAEVTRWVNEQLRHRERVNRIRLKNAFFRKGLDLKGGQLPPGTPNQEEDGLEFKPLDAIPAELCQLALDKKSTDNVSVVLIMLEPPPVEMTQVELENHVLKTRADRLQADPMRTRHRKNKSLFERIVSLDL